MSCCDIAKIDPCVAQGANKTFQFTDAATADYSTATELTFDVWQGGIGGASMISKTLSGGHITLPSNNVLQLSLTSAETEVLPVGSHHAEVWATFSGLQRQCVGKGTFKVIDTRKHD